MKIIIINLNLIVQDKPVSVQDPVVPQAYIKVHSGDDYTLHVVKETQQLSSTSILLLNAAGSY